MRLLDLFCGAGGAGMGYHRAGFEVVGVDNRPQKRYPFTFIHADALEYLAAHGHEYDVIHASPPCQAHCALKTMPTAKAHADLIPETRRLLQVSGRPWVIENVPGAPLVNPVMLCGTMFGLQTKLGSQLRRHRLFEFWTDFVLPRLECVHAYGSVIGVHGGGQHLDRRIFYTPATIGVYGHSGPGCYSSRDGRLGFGAQDRRDAMGIDWMVMSELSQAIPPAYTEFIGRALLKELHNA